MFVQTFIVSLTEESDELSMREIADQIHVALDRKFSVLSVEFDKEIIV